MKKACNDYKRQDMESDLVVVLEQDQTRPAPKPTKPKAIPITKVELVNDAVKFSVTKGVIKKRQITVKEIPIAEIIGVDGFGKEISITSNDVCNLFVCQKKGESFIGLRDQILALIEEQQKTREINAKAQLRRSDLSRVIKGSAAVVDLSFNMLMSLQVQKIDWAKLESYVNDLGQNLNFAVQTLPPLTLDFSKVVEVVKGQVPQRASDEIFNVLKSIYGYFNELNPEEALQTHPNFKEAKALILAYYTLNDILLGKLVGEKNNKKELFVLETTLQNLAKDTDFKVNFEDLVGNFDKISSDAYVEGIIADCREIFKEQLKNIERHNEQLSWVKPSTEPAIAQPELHSPSTPHEPVPPSEPQALVQPPTLEPVVEQQVAIHVPIELTTIEQTESALLSKTPEPMQPINPQELMITPMIEPSMIEQQGSVQPPTEQPSAKQQELAQTEVASPKSEDITKTSTTPPKKKSAGRRLRKAILGY